VGGERDAAAQQQAACLGGLDRGAQQRVFEAREAERGGVLAALAGEPVAAALEGVGGQRHAAGVAGAKEGLPIELGSLGFAGC
jgi:hypothetical protein